MKSIFVLSRILQLFPFRFKFIQVLAPELAGLNSVYFRQLHNQIHFLISLALLKKERTKQITKPNWKHAICGPIWNRWSQKGHVNFSLSLIAFQPCISSAEPRWRQTAANLIKMNSFNQEDGTRSVKIWWKMLTLKKCWLQNNWRFRSTM